MSDTTPRPLVSFSPRSAARTAALVAALLASLAAPDTLRAQTVPGFQVSTYATVPDPALLAFAPDGTLYTGGDTIAAGGSTPVKLNRIGVGGSPVSLFGDVPTSDPDTCVVDVAGTISGIPGSVLVSGVLGTSSVGRISAIHPDGSVVTLFEGGAWSNIAEMTFDLAGRLLLTSVPSRSIWVSTGGEPTILATLAGSAYPHFITIDAGNRIIIGASDGTIRIYNADGSLANGSLATFGKLAGLECGRGGAFGTDVYALDSVAGTLVRVSSAGVKTTVGTGFPTGLAIRDLAVGPSCDLFVSLITTDTVQIVSGQWSFLGSALAGIAGNPLLIGTGTLAAGSLDHLDLSLARPSAAAGLFIALSAGSVPFKGGTLVPFPFLAPVILATSASGTLQLPFLMPAGLPGGTPLVCQWAIQDAAAVQGVALSNAVKGVAP